MEQFTIIDASFQPKQTDDLKPGLHDWIDRRARWQAQWMITEEDGGSYIGQWAMMPINEPFDGEFWAERHPEFPYLWVPLCDLKIHDSA